MNKTEFVDMLLASNNTIIKDKEIYARVSLDSLRDVLENHGWSFVKEHVYTSTFDFKKKDDDGNPISLQLPLGKDFSDYGVRVCEIIRTICDLDTICEEPNKTTPILLLAELLGVKEIVSKEKIRDIRHGLCEALVSECGIEVSGGVDCAIDRVLKKHLG